MRGVLWLASALLGTIPARAAEPAPDATPATAPPLATPAHDPPLATEQLRGSIALERLFGLTRTWSNEVDAQRQTSTSLALGAAYLEHPGYATPRVALDVLVGPGISLGAGVGYARYTRENPDEDIEKSYALLAPRVGLLLQPLPRLIVWPRAGVTLLVPGRQTSENHLAITLELPLIWRLGDGVIGLSAAPHLDLGVGGGSRSTDDRVSELGLALGANLLF